MRWMVLVGLAAALVGCVEEAPIPPLAPAPAPAPATDSDCTVPASERFLPRSYLQDPLAEAERDPAPPSPPTPRTPSMRIDPSIAASLDAFAIDLFRALPQGQNSAVSPPAVASALAVAVPGAKGATRAEIRRALHARSSDAELLKALGQLLFRDEDGCDLDNANRAFVQSGLPLVSTYEETIRSSGQAPVERIDFARSPEDARARINAWAREQTRSRLQELLPPDAIKSGTRVALVSALAFTGKWREPFAESSTSPRDFRLPDGKRTSVDTMQAFRYASFARVEGARLLELPYRCGEVAMLFVLPETKEPEPPPPSPGGTGLGLEGLAARVTGRPIAAPTKQTAAPQQGKTIPPMEALRRVERSLSAETLRLWTSQLAGQGVSIRIPRFDVERGGSMNEILRRLGIRTAFTGAADFSNLTAADRLSIDDTFDQVRVHVDEEGTEAAAAAAVILGSRGSGPNVIATFHADHPFLFFLRDVRSGAILFLGRVVDPR